MSPLLTIKDFQEVFWAFEAGRCVEVTWVKWPVVRGGTSYRRLMATAQGRSAFAVFNGIVRLVARERTGGMLTLKGTPITAEDINVETNIPVKAVEEGIAILQRPEIGWLVPFREAGKDRPPDGQGTDTGRAANGSLSPVRPPAPAHASGSGSDSASSSSDAGAFGRFWAAWPRHPRKSARRQCQKLWNARGLDAQADAICAAVEKFKRSLDWTKEGGQFIPAPLVWLNQDRWEAADGLKQGSAQVPPQVAENRARARQWLRLGDNERGAFLDYREAHPDCKLEDSQLLAWPVFHDFVAAECLSEVTA